MEFEKFKISLNQQNSFENAFKEILKEADIVCGQWEFEHHHDHIIAEIPKYALDKMTITQIETLNEFVIE